MGRALLTDLYELNMAASYLRRGMTRPATFSLFVRDLPAGWGFLVACGLDACLDYLETFRFDEEDLRYLRELSFPPETIEAFSQLRFSGDVRALPEGTVCYPDEPLLEVTAPLPEAQLVETYLLNQVTYQTAVASKAARCRLAAPGADLVDFSLRRVHGNEAGLGVTRAMAIAGFSATSNVEAARRLGLTATGTMAHSYVEAFPSELDAFRAFAEDFPERVILLVDTYDTRSGVENAVQVARELASRGGSLAGIRLDSGDLVEGSRAARRALDEAGLTEVRIVASGGLDEHVLSHLTRAGARIDAYGVGTKVGVAEDAPALDTVYKLVEYDGRPVAKLSAAKRTLPGRKAVWRGPDGDVIGLADEDPPPGGVPLLVDAMTGGERRDRASLRDAIERCAADLAALPDERRALDALPSAPRRTPALTRLAEKVALDLRRREIDA